MQHNRAGRKLRRTTSHRLAMFSNQLDSLMNHERIQTTLSKAKELRPLAEKLITRAKKDDVAARRHVSRWIPDRTTIKRVFETIAPRFVDRPGGYTRILRLGARKGDAAEAAILEFVDFQFEVKDRGPRKESLSDRARRASGGGRVETVRNTECQRLRGAALRVDDSDPTIS
jgi:large subunit ribosomal protein L17